MSSLRSQSLNFRNFTVTFPGEHIVLVTLTNTRKLNCIDKATSKEIGAIWDQLDHDETLWVGIITGTGRAFCTGADLHEWNKMNQTGVVNSMAPPGLAGLPRRSGKKPIIAAVNGLCMGGGFEMVANCDVVLASTAAKFSLPEGKRGIVPVAGCLPRLTRTMGLQRTMDLVLTGREVDAKTLHSWGVVSRLVDEGQDVGVEAVKVAHEMCRNSPDALVVGRIGVRMSWEDGSVEGAVTALENEWYPRLMAGQNFQEGIQAFVEKRPTKWVDSKLSKASETQAVTAGDEKKDLAAADVAAVNNGSDVSQHGDSDRSDENLQEGVRAVEAVTLSWSKKTLALVFFNIWMLYLCNAFMSSIVYNLVPYVASFYESHSELNIIYIVSDVMTASVFIPLSKVLDVWGRPQGFLLMATLITLGIVLMAACTNYAMFCAAYVFYNVGFMGVTFCIDVITADASKVKNRGLAYAFTSSPYMITAFAGSKAAEGWWPDNWRWGIGMFAILFPVVAAPLFFILLAALRRAKEQGLMVKEDNGRTMMQSLWHYFVQFDAPGVFLFSAGLIVFLLPFNLAYRAEKGWESGHIIAMLVVGFFILVGFGLYETFVAPVPMLNLKMLTNRTIIGTCLMNATYQIGYYCWANYFTSFLQVVNNVTMAEAGYISSTFGVVSGFLLFIVGYSIHKTGYFKWLLYIAVPIYLLGQGLMIYFRTASFAPGYLIMCQVFTSIGGAIFIIVQQVAVLAAVDHQRVAAVLGLLFVIGSTGGAIGSTVSGAIWSNTFSPALERYLPEDALENLTTIAYDLQTQLSYEVGSATRIAIQEAYSYAQTRMVAAGTGVMALTIVWTLMIRNINVAKVNNTKGTLF
ncbi:ClpP/crotonase-like domain-containing protein [Rhypophila decipiens]|uniref:ClpP/crotonase-like domain-containing protein n=1 Tax=Rhypophila decipiens TaxID=261697 RepID=A0AAN6YAK9_9PEZI|nr:ClpP/crotonase-like domain-containing protein [Rhypophila decipiens]